MTIIAADPRSHVLRRNNVRESGDRSARPIVFAHGFGCSQEMWQAMPEYVAASPISGHGYRLPRDLQAVHAPPTARESRS